MSKIPLGTIGRILNGRYQNMMIRVDDDTENTGGFLIYQWWDGSDGPNECGAYDNWVESPAALEQYFAHSGWSIEWESVKNA